MRASSVAFTIRKAHKHRNIALVLGGRVRFSNPFMVFFVNMLILLIMVFLYGFSAYWQVLMPVAFILGLSTGTLFAGERPDNINLVML